MRKFKEYCIIFNIIFYINVLKECGKCREEFDIWRLNGNYLRKLFLLL